MSQFEKFITHIKDNIWGYVGFGVFILCIILPIIIFGGIGFLDNLQYFNAEKFYTDENYDIDRCEGSLPIYINRILIILAIIYILMKTILKDFFKNSNNIPPPLRPMGEIWSDVEKAETVVADSISEVAYGITSAQVSGSKKVEKMVQVFLLSIIPIIFIIIASISISELGKNGSLNIINVLSLIFTLIITNKLINHEYFILISIVLLIPLILFLSSCAPSSNTIANILSIIYYITLIVIIVLANISETKQYLDNIKLFKTENFITKLFNLGGKKLKKKK